MSLDSAGEFRKWKIAVKPVLMSMMAVLYFAQDASTRSTQVMLAAGDQLQAASSHAITWIPSHRCPRTDLDGMFIRMARSYSDVADLIESEVRSPRGPDRRAVSQELAGLVGSMAVMWSVMREQSEAESSW
jgi:hypothetical protein